MKKITTVLLAVLLLFISVTHAQDEEDAPGIRTIQGKHQAGVRMGGWINQGDTPNKVYTSEDGLSQIETSIKDGNFYIEGFFAYNLLPSTFLEISAGLANRGSVTVFEDNNTDIGNLIVYPMLLNLKFYPIAHTSSRLQPFVNAGGGLYYGRRDVQIIRNYYSYYYDFRGDTETDFNFSFGGGFDWLLSDILAVELNARYMPITFKDQLVGVNKYDGLSITIGIKYLKSK